MNKQSWMLIGGAALLMSACGGGGGGSNTPPVTEAVPAAAGTDSEASTQYLVQLTAVTPARSDALEPVAALPDKLATDDTAEPREIP
jgi:hypothetical protein